MTAKRNQEFEGYKTVDSNFADFVYFEADNKERIVQKKAFLDDAIFVPNYSYPKLADLRFNEELKEKKRTVYQAVLKLEAVKSEDDTDKLELEIYADYLDLRLKRIMLVESARDLSQVHTSGEWEVAKNSFIELNNMVYGEFDVPTYQSMIAGEYDMVNAFLPTSDLGVKTKNELVGFLKKISPESKPEQPLLSDIEIDKIRSVIIDRYKDILDVIPKTDETIYYNAEECAAIINDTLTAGGLNELGWISEANPQKVAPVTSLVKRRIFLPSDTRRNADELRRLVIHEQEVHARRGENGRQSGFKPLLMGTANFLDVEEGLGVLLECVVAESWDNASFRRARDRYIAVGLALSAGEDNTARNACHVHDVLWRMFAVRNSQNGNMSDEIIDRSKKDAYTYVENIFRGTEFWMGGVIYTKAKVYYEGLEKNARFFHDNINNIDSALDTALIGKYNHTDSTEREIINEILINKKQQPEESHDNRA
jgi:hypothetical protein